MCNCSKFWLSSNDVHNCRAGKKRTFLSGLAGHPVRLHASSVKDCIARIALRKDGVIGCTQPSGVSFPTGSR